MTPIDVMMIGPFPSDADRIEGGVQASLFGLASELSTRAEISSLTVMATPVRPTTGIRHDRIAGIDVTFLDTPFRFLVSSILRIPAILATLGRMPAPLVHLHGTGVVQSAVLLVARLRRIPLVWTMHGITEKELWEALRREGGFKAWARFLLYAACERFQLRLSRHLVVDTPYVGRAVAHRAAVRPRAIPQGILPEEPNAARIGERHEPVVISLGVIHPRKGHALTLRAFAEVVRAVPDARLMIVGSLADPAHLEELERSTRDLGLDGRVEFHVGVSRGEVLAALHRARVFALHSQEESQGIALCEAMAGGLPVVATRVGGIPDVFGASGAGYLVEYGDVDAMAGHLIRLLTDDVLAAGLAAAARRRAADFAWDAITDRILEVYRAARGG
ncbi:MAG: glycosyltransferase family 4 protein [Siculibacillus sp.]|nr:glycosyltransferase family 4 protein [Siculibacillus sp.]